MQRRLPCGEPPFAFVQLAYLTTTFPDWKGPWIKHMYL
jgi:hypothetical protein